jgi:hypothetical protein
MQFKKYPVSPPIRRQTSPTGMQTPNDDPDDESNEDEAAETPPKKLKGKNFIKDAIKRPGALHKKLGVPQGKKIPKSKITAAAKVGGQLGQEARFAETLEGMKKK